MHFIALLVDLRPLGKKQTLSISDASNAHAALFHAISATDPLIGQQLHNMKRHKQISLAIIPRRPQLRLTLMDVAELACSHTVINALAAKRVLRIGKRSFEVANINVADAVWARTATWADFQRNDLKAFLRFHFVTPTAITKRGRRKRYHLLFPNPSDLFTGLLRRWKALNGPSLPKDLIPFVEGGGCIVVEHTIHSQKFRDKNHLQNGFVGRVTYQLNEADQIHSRALNSLAELAFFTGVGYQTARGMGLTRVKLSD